MDALRSLKAALAHARWLSRVEEALVLVPNLLAEMPELVSVRVQASEEVLAPCGFTSRLYRPVSRLIATRLKAARAGEVNEDLRELQPQVLKQDALVRELAELLVESAPFGRPAQSLVLLELVRLSSGVFARDRELLDRVQQDGLDADLGWLASQTPEARGELLSGLAFSIQVRLGAAYALTKGLARPGRLYQSLVASRLPLVLRASNLELPRDLVLVARVLEQPTADATLRAAWAAGRAALEEGMAQDSAAGAILRAEAAEGRSIDGLMLHRRSLGLGLSLLPALVNQQQLQAQGLSAREASALLGPAAVAATTGLMDVVEACRRLDLISALASSLLPVERRAGRWRSGGSEVSAPLLELLVPSSLDEAAHAHVVGVRLGQQANQLVADPRALGGLAALGRIWEQLESQALELGGRVQRGGPPFLAAFSDEPAARSFEALLTERMERLDLQIGSLGSVQLSEAFHLARVEGPLVGGWCGHRLVLAGPPVEAVLGGGGAAGSLWDDEVQTVDEDSTGPVFDPFNPTPVSVEEDVDEGPPADWSEGLVGAIEGDEPPVEAASLEDLGEAVSYDLLGMPPLDDDTELTSNQDPATEDEVVLEPFSQDVLGSDESILGVTLDTELDAGLSSSFDADLSASLDADLSDGLETSLTESGFDLNGEDTESIEVDPPVERQRPVIPELSSPSGFSFPSDDSLDGPLELSNPEPSFPEPSFPEDSFPEDSDDEESEVEMEFEIEDDEDSELLEAHEAGSAVAPAEALHTFDMLGDSLDGFEDWDEASDDGWEPSAPSEPEQVDLGQPFYLPPPAEDGPSNTDSLLEIIDSLNPADGVEFSDVDLGDLTDDDLSLGREPEPLSIGEDAPAFPDLGLDLDVVEVAVPEPEPEPSVPEQPTISRADLDFLFQGYVVVSAEGGFIFGRAYGSTLVDVHRYLLDEPTEAHLAFARDKIRERFSPASDETLTLSGRDRPEPVSLDLLIDAFED